jgi:hypothetical protein
MQYDTEQGNRNRYRQLVQREVTNESGRQLDKPANTSKFSKADKTAKVYQEGAHGAGVELLLVSKVQMAKKRKEHAQKDFNNRRAGFKEMTAAKMKKVYAKRQKATNKILEQANEKSVREAMAERFKGENMLRITPLGNESGSTLVGNGNVQVMPVPTALISEKLQKDAYDAPQGKSNACHNRAWGVWHICS